mmetsp:Transcript_30498/g.95378  ORF Transcript_30498/g.95378 Transcript_30498/m.95378 type:complete len:203 (+) Transcript_30498:651-1259(+)
MGVSNLGSCTTHYMAVGCRAGLAGEAMGEGDGVATGEIAAKTCASKRSTASRRSGWCPKRVATSVRSVSATSSSCCSASSDAMLLRRGTSASSAARRALGTTSPIIRPIEGGRAAGARRPPPDVELHASVVPAAAASAPERERRVRGVGAGPLAGLEAACDRTSASAASYGWGFKGDGWADRRARARGGGGGEQGGGRGEEE